LDNPIALKTVSMATFDCIYRQSFSCCQSLIFQCEHLCELSITLCLLYNTTMQSNASNKHVSCVGLETNQSTV